MSLATRSWSWLVLFACLFLLGCPGKQVITETPTVEAAEEQQATCKVAKDPLNPLIVEWPGTSKVDLDSASQRSVVVVSYAGCTLKVLTSCRARLKKEHQEGVPYDLTSVTPARDKLQIADQSELYARLPLGAASLKGELSLGSSLELDYIAVGQRVAKSAPEVLEGECEGATHFVRTITVGAYSLDVMAKGKAAGSVEVGNAGAGVGREESRRNLRGSGDVDACAGTPNGKECGAVLQLGLAPLQREGERLLNNAGFGAGLGPTGNVYIPDLDNLNVSSASFRNVDSTYLKLVDSAMQVEKQKIPATDKVRAWEKVRDHKADGEFRDESETRVEEWQRVADAEERRREALDKLREKYLEDKRKLDDLLAITSEQLASPAQKTAWRKEFDVAYAPHQKDLEELGLRSGTSSSSGGTSASGTGASADTPTTDPAQKDWVIGTPIGIEAEAGYSAFGATFLRNDEKTYALGGHGFVGGVNLGLPNLGAGFGLMATFRVYPVSGTAISVGGQLRWTVPLTDFVSLELAGGGGYATYLSGVDRSEEDLGINLDGDTSDGQPVIEDDVTTQITASGASLDFTGGFLFNYGILVFGLRGGATFAALSLEAPDADAEVQQSLTAVGETTIAGLVTGVIGVAF
ncbi:MAG: hypothetical protein JNL21_40490 [Myxococcales bacterium]|nr:hypothetical protein [Myxococcales bacterium]